MRTAGDSEGNRFDPETGEALPQFNVGDSSFGKVLDPNVMNWGGDMRARALAEIALEMTALDDDVRLTVCKALPRLEALLANSAGHSAGPQMSINMGANAQQKPSEDEL
jgi:hypothetical protein